MLTLNNLDAERPIFAEAAFIRMLSFVLALVNRTQRD
jgi:hypothetical protein